MPVARELVSSMGASAATKKSLTTLLTKSHDPREESNRDGNTANAVALVIGGMLETKFFHPNRYIFVVAERRGFQTNFA